MSLRWLLVFAAIVTSSIGVQAQRWIPANNGLYGGQAPQTLTFNDYVFGGTYGGIYRSSDGGKTWVPKTNGFDNRPVNSMVSIGDEIFVATNHAQTMLKSNDNGESWTSINTGLPPDMAVVEIVAHEENLIALTSSAGLYTSSDKGNSWTPLPTPNGLLSLTAMSNILLGATYTGLLRSIDGGSTWTSFGFDGVFVYDVIARDGVVIASTMNGIHLSLTQGSTWLSTGFSHGYFGLTKKGNTIVAGNRDNTYRSLDNGNSWSAMTLKDAASFTSIDNILVGATDHGMFRSSNDGATWTMNNEGMTNARVMSAAQIRDHLFISTFNNVYKSTDKGLSWQQLDNGLPGEPAWQLFASGESLLAAYSGGLYRSTNSGISWQKVRPVGFDCFAGFNGKLFAGKDDGTFVSVDEGFSWTQVNSTLSANILCGHLGKLYAAGYGYVRISANEGVTWTDMSAGLDFNQCFPTKLFSHKAQLFLATENCGLYKLENNKWVLSGQGMSPFSNHLYSFAISPDSTTLYVTGSDGVHQSTDVGKNWTAMRGDFPLSHISSWSTVVLVHQNQIFAGTNANGMWYWEKCLKPKTPTVTISEIAGKITLTSSAITGNQWYVDGNIITGATDQILFPDIVGNYSVRIISGDCESDASLISQVGEEPFILEMPNVFTPNEDDKNPKFIPLAYAGIENATIKIVDRWGKEVFQSNDLLAGWDGDDCAPSVYFYQIIFTDVTQKQQTVKGWVHLFK